MQRRLATLVGVAGAALLLASACSSDSTPSREEMIDQAMEEGGMDETTATCLVDGLLDEFGSERVDEIVNSNDELEDLSEEEQSALIEVTTECLDPEGVLEDTGVSIDGAPSTTTE